MTDEGLDPITLRSGSYEDRASDLQPAPMSLPKANGTPALRRSSRGEHPLAEAGLGVTSSLAVAGWLAAGTLIVMLVNDRSGPEAMTGLAVAFSMPPVLVTALGFSAAAVFIWHRYRGGRVSLVVSIMAALAAVVAPLIWIAVVIQ
ncbi:hypothetical protein [Plantactinospora endophytica]|uniref:Uncharacterized protein n=1 Tax=Plantactinospora endophytica TaxID=673535 RepID=A0ABQ4EFA4_9ACTN|nr:hypothetical protein [Plantactinospora endophytica]GIG93401.1 hypothetical protein Pen02_83370 [Plantactinospora endophytica]